MRASACSFRASGLVSPYLGRRLTRRVNLMSAATGGGSGRRGLACPRRARSGPSLPGHLAERDPSGNGCTCRAQDQSGRVAPLVDRSVA